MCCFLPFLRSSWLLVLVVTWFGTFVACLFPVSLVSMRGPVFLVERRLWVFLLFCASPPFRVTKRRGDDGPKFSYEETMSWGMDVHGHIVTSHCNMKSLPAFVRRPLLGMGLAVGQWSRRFGSCCVSGVTPGLAAAGGRGNFWCCAVTHILTIASPCNAMCVEERDAMVRNAYASRK